MHGRGIKVIAGMGYTWPETELRLLVAGATGARACVPTVQVSTAGHGAPFGIVLHAHYLLSMRLAKDSDGATCTQT